MHFSSSGLSTPWYTVQVEEVRCHSHSYLKYPGKVTDTSLEALFPTEARKERFRNISSHSYVPLNTLSFFGRGLWIFGTTRCHSHSYLKYPGKVTDTSLETLFPTEARKKRLRDISSLSLMPPNTMSFFGRGLQIFGTTREMNTSWLLKKCILYGGT